MGESHTLFRLTIFIGFVLLMSSVLAQPWVYVGQPLPANSPWGQFSNGIQNFPSFSNPYASPVSTIVQVPIADGSPNAIESTTGCSIGSFFNCLASNDNGTYITLNATDNGLGGNLGGFFNVAMTNITGNAILSSTVIVWCRIPSWNVTNLPIGIDNARPGPTITRNGVVSPTCNTQDFAPLRIPVKLATGGFPVADSTWQSLTYTVGAGITLRLGTVHQKVQVTYIELETQVDLGGGISCGSTWDVGCQLSRLVDPLVKFGLLIGNGVVFGFAVLFWFFGMVGIFFSAFASILNVPGAPPLVSALIALPIIGAIFFVAIVFMGKIRGTGNTG